MKKSIKILGIVILAAVLLVTVVIFIIRRNRESVVTIPGETEELVINEEEVDYYVNVWHGDNSNSGLSRTEAKRTIANAIETASPGDTILVTPGMYRESVVIDKPLSLIGEDKEGTVLHSRRLDFPEVVDIIKIISDNVTVSGLTINYLGVRENMMGAGIKLSGVENCKITNNIIARNHHGIYLESSNNNQIINNEVLLNRSGGIYLRPNSNKNTITNNTVQANGGLGGIFLWDSCNENLIENNVVKFNPGHGIKLLNSSNNNIIRNNESFNNDVDGIYIGESDDNLVSSNTIISNGSGIVLIHQSSNNQILDNTTKFNIDVGIHISDGATKNIIENNKIEKEISHGILVLNTSGNTISKNTINLCDNSGIQLQEAGSNKITGNRITNSSMDGLKDRPGMTLEHVNNNEISYNFIINNPSGFSIEGSSSGNKIHNNNIEGVTHEGIHNHTATEVDAINNWWGDPSGPYHRALNPDGKGSEVSDNVLFEPWLDAPIE